MSLRLAATAVQPSLTPREREVLALIASGKGTKETAKTLGIAFKTAVCHRQRIMGKLEVHNMAQITIAAVRLGVIGIRKAGWQVLA